MEVSIRRAGEGQGLRVVGDVITPRLTAERTGGAYELFDLAGPMDSGPPLHTHPWAEAYLVLEGHVEVTAGGRGEVLGPGDSVFIPAQEAHAYRILSPQARFLVITTPVGAAGFFADIDASVGELPRDFDLLLAAAGRHGAEVVGTGALRAPT